MCPSSFFNRARSALLLRPHFREGYSSRVYRSIKSPSVCPVGCIAPDARSSASWPSIVFAHAFAAAQVGKVAHLTWPALRISARHLLPIGTMLAMLEVLYQIRITWFVKRDDTGLSEVIRDDG